MWITLWIVYSTSIQNRSYPQFLLLIFYENSFFILYNYYVYQNISIIFNSLKQKRNLLIY